MDWRRRSGEVDVPHDLFNSMEWEGILNDKLEKIQLRTSFPETWLFEQGKTIYRKTDDEWLVSFDVTVPDTITTWVMQAIAVSNTTGFGLTPPFNLRSFKPLFVSVKLPYSAQRGEQVSVIATVYNYEPSVQTINVHLFRKPGDSYCTYSKGTLIYEVQVNGNGAVSVAFPIVPTELGDIPVEVRIVSRAGFGDGERRILKVLPEGIERREIRSVVLDPSDVLRDLVDANASVAPVTPPTTRKGHDGQTDQISLKFPNSSIPESEYVFLTVIGNLIGSSVSNIIEGQGLELFIRLPTGCGEQTMSMLAPLVYVFNYLRSTKQATKDIKESAFKYMQSGYKRMLNYRLSDNAFGFYIDLDSETWVTAYVVKTFCAIKKFDGIDIDQNVINQAMDWLATQQRADGSFAVSWFEDLLFGVDAIEVTAYVLTAFTECERYFPNIGQNTRRAVTYLENVLTNASSIHEKALIAYALALADSPLKLKANEDLLNSANYDPDRNTRYWHDPRGFAGKIETTSYVLLTQVVLNRIAYAGPIVLWLTEQNNGGGYFSTQDTCVALQALAAYSEATAGRDQINLRVEVCIGDKYKKTLLINQRNALVQQQLDISSYIGDELFIKTTGTGVAQLQVETRYNTPRTEKEECQFNLTVTTDERVKKMYDQPIIIAPKPTRAPKRKKPKAKKPKCRRKDGKKCRRRKPKCKGRRCKGKKRQKGGRRNKPRTTTAAPQVTTRPPLNDGPVPNSILIKICTRFKKAGKSAGMSIIDVGILTGFSIKQESLAELKDKVKPGISYYEVSDRHAILYIDEIPSDHELCYNLELTRDFEVGIVQPVPVTVYDYYEPDNKCTKFYGPKPDSRLNLATCKHHLCDCDLDKCSSCETSDNADYVKKLLCTRYDYGFKGKLIKIDEKDQWLHLIFDIVEVYRESNTKKITRKRKHIKYSKRISCNCPEFAGKSDSHFLIMGKDRGLQGSSKIVLGHDVFVKSWPSKNSNFSKKFLGLLRNGC